MDNLNVLYQSDDNYAVYLGVSIYSFLENNKEYAGYKNVYIIDDHISVKNKEKMKELVAGYQTSKVIFVNPNVITQDPVITESFAYLGMRKNIHSYFKLFIDKLVPELNEKIIYIDCDTVVTGDLSHLLNIDMEDKPIGMVRDALVTGSKRYIGLKAEDEYYNSGVILMNLPTWRTKDCSGRILHHVQQIRTYGTVDQDILNVEFRGEIVTLPIRYNFQTIHLECPYQVYRRVFKNSKMYYKQEEIENAAVKPSIIHFVRFLGELPGNCDNTHPGKTYFERYFFHSPWSSCPKQTTNKKMIFRIEKKLHKWLPQRMFLEIFNRIHEFMIFQSNRSQS